ncbi:MAG TPA: beta-galactosidase trimerization domain-containing protein [Capsulimonadaceae bacterium]
MNKSPLVIAALVSVFVTVAANAAPPATAKLASLSVQLAPVSAVMSAATVVDSNSVLRGYGRLKATFRTVTFAGQSYNVWQFDATSPSNARIVAGKFLADVTLSPGVSRGTLKAAGRDMPLITVTGGLTYTGYAAGNSGLVIATGSDKALKRYLDASPAIKTGSISTSLTYPTYLDRFDRYGWGFYGFRSDWSSKKRDGSTDPVADMEWCAKNNFRFELWPKPMNFDDSYGLPETHDMGWLIAEAEKRNVPISSRLYGDTPHVKEYTDAFEQPMSFMEGGWYWPTLGWRGIPHQSWFHPLGRLFIAKQAQEEIKLYKDHPEISSWMMPYGEVSFYDWYAYHADRSPAAVDSWRANLRAKHKLSLTEVSAMYNRSANPFRSWDEVGVPEVATFAGLPGLVKDLEGDWLVRPETASDEGIKGEWWNADTSTASWERMHMPGSVFWWRYAKKTKWAIHDFDVAAAELSTGKPVYLYSYARAVNNQPRSFMPAYLNGVKLGEVRTWGAWDVTKLLKPGHNRIALQTDLFGGRVFLSTEAPQVYPYLSPARNRMWLMFNEWLLDSKYDTIAITLAAMREAEPNKPFKIMAPTGLGSDRWLSLSHRFGAWGHFTGEGVWAFFWYKRYGYLYGLPGTSEGGGPAHNLEDQVRLYQRVFLEGLNGHDQVFTVQDVTSLPAVKQFYDDHIAVLKQMGRYDIAGPQVVLFRPTDISGRLMPEPSTTSTKKTPEIQSYWNWDIGRGTLQSIGHSALYLDDTGLAEGRNKEYPIMMDCGNEIMTEKSVTNIEAWVRAGGTFVTLPFTGRSLPDKPDTWPIDRLTGCSVAATRTPGAGKGTITILKSQTLLKELAGKTFPDSGSTMDWQDFEHNIVSTELKPGADCQVVAKFDNGAPAIVVRKLGAGRVIVLGSAFFKGVHDVMGIWWPSVLESRFYRDLLNGLGQPSLNSAGDYRVFTQRYRTNNGLDDVIVADNFADADRTVTLRAVVAQKPSRVYRVSMNTVQDVPFTMDGNTVVVSGNTIPKSEVQVFYIRRGDTTSAPKHWLAYQQKLWKPTEHVKVDMKPLTDAGWDGFAMDLKPDWRWTQTTPSGTDWHTATYDDRSWGRWNLDIFNAVSADPARSIYARKVFQVPAAWLKDSGVIKLTAAGWSWPFTVGDGSAQITLNGTVLQKQGYFNPDVARLLRSGTNIITIELGPPKTSNFIGVTGSLYLTHFAPPVKTIDLAGQWTSVHETTPVTFALPGKGKAFAPQRTFDVPAEWKGKYIVTYHAIGARTSTIGCIINETGMIRRHHHLFGDELETDITPFLKFGQQNTIALLPDAGDWLPASLDWDIAKMELRLYPRK